MGDKRGTGRPIPPVFLPVLFTFGQVTLKNRFTRHDRRLLRIAVKNRARNSTASIACKWMRSRVFFSSFENVGWAKEKGAPFALPSFSPQEQDFRKYFSCVTSFPFSRIEEICVFVFFSFFCIGCCVVVYALLDWNFLLFFFLVNKARKYEVCTRNTLNLQFSLIYLLRNLWSFSKRFEIAGAIFLKKV